MRGVIGGCGITGWLLLLAGCQSPPPPPPVPRLPPRAMPANLVIGQTALDRPIHLSLFGDPSRPVVLILGGIHGNEPTGAAVCRELIGWLEQHPEAWQDRCVAVVPMSNPDGLSRRIRTNDNLVDINRNFPSKNWKVTRRSGFFGGDAPATEPENVAIIGLVDRLKPVRIVSVHSMDAPCNNYDGPGEALAKAMASHNGYPVKASIGYPTPGSFGSFAGIDRQIPTITLELPTKQSGLAAWKRNREALVTAITGVPAQPATWPATSPGNPSGTGRNRSAATVPSRTP